MSLSPQTDRRNIPTELLVRLLYGLDLHGIANQNINYFCIGTPTKASADEKGGLHSGTGKRHKPRPDKDDHIIPGEGRKNKEDNAGIDGDFSKEVDVTYRGIAQKEKGHYYHYLKINSPEDIENGRIVISTGREFGGSEPLNIIETSDGKTCRNSIYNLKLKKGSNTLIIRFADNLSHTLTLDVYEDKR